MISLFQNVLDAYAELDDKIFEAYCEQKTDPLVGALEPGMYEGHFDWSDCPKPTGMLEMPHVDVEYTQCSKFKNVEL